MYWIIQFIFHDLILKNDVSFMNHCKYGAKNSDEKNKEATTSKVLKLINQM